jgi:hypothetical protein
MGGLSLVKAAAAVYAEANLHRDAKLWKKNILSRQQFYVSREILIFHIHGSDPQGNSQPWKNFRNT